MASQGCLAGIRETREIGLGQQAKRLIVKHRDTLAAEPGYGLHQAYLDAQCRGGGQAVIVEHLAALVGKPPPEHSR
jgi:hypothetical protein